MDTVCGKLCYLFRETQLYCSVTSPLRWPAICLFGRLIDLNSSRHGYQSNNAVQMLPLLLGEPSRMVGKRAVCSVYIMALASGLYDH